MSRIWTSEGLIKLPLNGSGGSGYKRNYIKQAVCELRFPTLFSLSEARPPQAFARALRKQYPHQETGSELTVTVGSSTETEFTHVFRTSKLTWTVTLKQSSVVIETTNYTGFADMQNRISEVVGAVIPVIDADFFTRIGVRYINVIDVETSALEEWVNPHLVSTISHGIFSGVSDYAGRLALQSEDGGCLLQHGIRHKQVKQSAIGPRPVPDYVIDIDVFRTEVPVAEAMNIVESAHLQAFALFDWSTGPKAKDYLRGM